MVTADWWNGGMATTADAPALFPPDDPAPGSLGAWFHPAVGAWFTRRFPGGPTAPQSAAWPLIATGQDVLVASPTGTGKTLTGFLVAIDAAYRAHQAGVPSTGLPEVLYVSPLRALAADVHENLQIPLAGIGRTAGELGLGAPELTVAVRTGDTPPAERAAMRRSPPDLLVTTPESLYLLLTAASSRSMLRRVRTVIVDEVHTLARDKRGAHLALSLERLAHVVAEEGGRLQRIGLSATQRPLEVVAGLLSGTGADRPMPAIVDCGHRRDLDVAIELPSAELEAVSSHGQFAEMLDRIADHVRQHRTTLMFVNTRKMAERVAHQLAERLEGDGDADDGLLVAAHHGSLSTARRRLVEARLRAGDLRALVATASLELGIDVGSGGAGVPDRLAPGHRHLPAAGRSGQPPAGGDPGRTALPPDPGRAGRVHGPAGRGASGPPGRAGAAGGPARRAGPAAGGRGGGGRGVVGARTSSSCSVGPRPTPGSTGRPSTRSSSWCPGASPTGRGRRGAHLHRDGVNGRLRARRGARLAALTSGGAIPETGDYRVVLDPEGVTVGSVHEDFAVEANIGDVFLLGTHSWRVRQVEVGTVRVHDAGDAAPTVPFWLGEAPARTAELSEEVGILRAAVEAALTEGEAGDRPAVARRVVRERSGVSEEVAEQVVTYLAAGWAALGMLPTRQRLVVERFFDESEGTQLVIHAPYGGRVNRALGLALRKRFCVSFDFELQAAADDDTVVLSLGPQHSFPLTQVPRMLSSRTAVDVLTQAVLPHPMLQARWRWNCNRALVVPRSRAGQRRPIHLQRMDADDLLAAAWPALAACQENAAAGPIPVPDHVLVRQTVADCLTEALDAQGLVDLLSRMEAGEVQVHLVESVEPSVLAHGILTGRPYTFLDGAPLEERRSRAVTLRRGLGEGGLPVPVDELGPLDGPAVEAVLDQVRPDPRDPDELHDLLLSLVRCRPVAAWQQWFDALVATGRAGTVGQDWAATERRAVAEALSPGGPLPGEPMDEGAPDGDAAAAECLRGHLELSGPVSEADAGLRGSPARRRAEGCAR